MGLVTKVVAAATGTLARQVNANNTAKTICARGMMMPTTMPSATPRGTERRVKRQSSGARTRFAKGERKRLARIDSCVGMWRANQRGALWGIIDLAPLAKQAALLAFPVPFLFALA